MPHHCHDEACSHDHSHDDDLTPALQSHLYSQLDFSGVRALNESPSGSGRKILEKTWAQRLDDAPELSSDADEQLILHVPFTGQVRLHSLHIRTSPASCAPLHLHLHANNPDLDFDSSAPPTQSFTLAQTSEVQDLPVKRAKFQTCTSVALFFEDNYGDDVTRIAYVGFKGDWMRLNREPVDVLYEAAANPSDHKVKGTAESVGGMGIGGGPGGRQGF